MKRGVLDATCLALPALFSCCNCFPHPSITSSAFLANGRWVFQSHQLPNGGCCTPNVFSFPGPGDGGNPAGSLDGKDLRPLLASADSCCTTGFGIAVTVVSPLDHSAVLQQKPWPRPLNKNSGDAAQARSGCRIYEIDEAVFEPHECLFYRLFPERIVLYDTLVRATPSMKPR